MATILIFSENWQIAHKLCDSYAKEKYDARLCSDPDQISAAADENGAPLMVIDAAMKWVVCRPIFERCRQTGSPILFVTSDRRMSDHLLALYPGRSDVVVTPFSRKTLAEKTRILLGGETPAREISVDETAQVALLNGRRVELTAQEMALLLALMNPRQPGAAAAGGLGIPEHGRDPHCGRPCTASAQKAGRGLDRDRL